MPASITDLIDQVSSSATNRPVIARLASPGKIIAAPSINIDDPTNWATDTAIHFSIYNVDANGKKDATTQTDWKGTLNTSVISNLTKTGGTDRAYTAGAIVELTPTAGWARDLYTWALAHGNPDGTLKTAAVKAALGIAGDPTGGWSILNAGTAPTIATGYNKGNKEFDLQFTGVDLTSVLTPGMRIKLDRSGTVPTQCTDLESTNSQYWTKTSPTGITFTDDFTVEAWIKLESYVTGVIAARITGANGWQMFVDNLGRLNITGGAGTVDTATSHLSLPLNQWIHVAATLDMSGATATMYFNGVSVGYAYANGAATSITQSGDLRVGNNDSTNYFDGEIAQVRVWSAIRTATQIRDNMAISTVGNETNLIADYKFNGNANDSTANANNLTAAGGATATSVDNPFKTTEMAIVQKVVFSTNTIVTVYTGTDFNIPNMILQNPFYSMQKTPFGFDSTEDKWTVEAMARADMSAIGGGATAGTWYFTNLRNSIPSGNWAVKYEVNAYGDRGTNGEVSVSTTLSTTNNSDTDPDFHSLIRGTILTASPAILNVTVSRSKGVSLTTQTNYTILMRANATGISNLLSTGTASVGTSRILAKNAYL